MTFLIRNLFRITAVAAMLALSTIARADNIAETAAKAGQFKTLLAAAQAAGLADALANSPNLTVFAPTDAAFDALPKGTVESLLKPENKAKLKAILAYHVLTSRVLAKDVPSQPTRVPTLGGTKLQVARNGDNVRAGDANVTTADILADNGVIHVIDKVLIPPAPKASSLAPVKRRTIAYARKGGSCSPSH